MYFVRINLALTMSTSHVSAKFLNEPASRDKMIVAIIPALFPTMSIATGARPLKKLGLSFH